MPRIYGPHTEREKGAIDHGDTQEIICPACGWIDTDSWESHDGEEAECPDCNSTFRVNINESVTYTTELITKDGPDTGGSWRCTKEKCIKTIARREV